MNEKLPGIIVTGASGFVGRHFLASAAGRYRLFCLARRSRQEAGIPEYQDMRWTQVDVAKWDTMRDVINCIKEHGGADYVLHLAGYYDFHNMENPEYDRTNVQGTRNVLKLSRQLGIKRFIFASSLAACKFPAPGESINEDSPADAEFAYARSKRQGEDMILEEAKWFPSAIVRMAAVYSDWCEYPPVYVFLRTWLSKAWNAKILGGRGESSVTYIHIQDLLKLMHRIIECSNDLPRTGIYNASPNVTTSHRDLYDAATRYFYGETPKPRCMPKWLCKPGVHLRFMLGRLMGKTPFEAPWMTDYIDQQLNVNSSRTQSMLGWTPSPRLEISRRLLLLIENMKANGEVWRQRNEEALRRIARRPNLIIADQLEVMREQLVEQLVKTLTGEKYAKRFKHYQDMEPESLRWFLMLVYQVLITSARTRDRRLMRQYAHMIAVRRRGEGIDAQQVQDALTLVGREITDSLQVLPELADLGQHLHDNVSLSFQLASDAVADAYEMMEDQGKDFTDKYDGVELPSTASDLQHMVRQMEDICEDTLPARLW
jgi:nucleoside-diphosphate-sugar epimerase